MLCPGRLLAHRCCHHFRLFVLDDVVGDDVFPLRLLQRLLVLDLPYLAFYEPLRRGHDLPEGLKLPFLLCELLF